jgi:hypothetical protein
VSNEMVSLILLGDTRWSSRRVGRKENKSTFCGSWKVIDKAV